MAPSPSSVLSAVKASGVRYSLCDRWDDPSIAASGTWAPSYVILHHTANGGASGNAPSLNYCLKGSYPPVRNCHFLVGRDGLVYVLTAYGCYHAGSGGPGKWGNGPHVNADSMNRYAYGIEIESKGTSTSTSGNNGYTPAQQDATARLTASLLAMLKRNDGCAINHKTWAPGRKTDTLYSDAYWHDKIATTRVPVPTPPKPLPANGVPLMAFMVRSEDKNHAYLVDAGRIVEVSAGMANNMLKPLNSPADGLEMPYYQAGEPGWSNLVRAFGPIVETE